MTKTTKIMACENCGKRVRVSSGSLRKTCSDKCRVALVRRRRRGEVVVVKPIGATPGSAFSEEKRHPAFAAGNKARLQSYNDPEEIVSRAARVYAEEVRVQLNLEYPGLEQARLSLPTVELYCNSRARALLMQEVFWAYVEGRKSRRVTEFDEEGKRRGRLVTGFDAVAMSFLDQLNKTESNAAKLAQDIGLDLTGRARALKDDAIRRNLDTGGPNLAALSGKYQRLKSLG